VSSVREPVHGTIIVVEDDASIAELLQLYLSREGYEVVTTAEGRAAPELVRSRQPVLMILDLMLPDEPGFQVLKDLRTFSAVPVIVLTAKDADQDKILGLELGADDYMTKPFNPGELVARVRAVLRRTSPVDETTTQVLGGVELVPEGRLARVDGHAVDLTPKEFDLLHYLLLNRGIALSRDRLLEEVWGYKLYGDARTVDVHVRQLRKKLGRWSTLIQTVWGLGYKADPEARAEEAVEGPAPTAPGPPAETRRE
jgi:DNA-binding response OmpR family regulator